MMHPLVHRCSALAASLVLTAASSALAQTYYQGQSIPQGTYMTPYRTYYPSIGGYYPGTNSNWYYDYYGRTPPSRTTQEQTGEEGGTRSGREMQQLRGEVIRTKHVETQNHTFLAALVETEDGRRVVVDLGPMHNLREENLNVQKGEEISVRGWYSNIGDHRVFMAHVLRADGQRVVIQRPFRPTEERLREEESLKTRASRYEGGEEQSGSEERRFEGGQSAGNMASQQCSGQIVRTSEVKLPELNDRLLFAQIRTEQGKNVTAMLGPVQELHALDLRKGEQISLKGYCIHVDGRSLLLTQQLRAQGHTFQADQQVHEKLLRRSAEVKGRVIRTKEIDLPGLEREIQVAVVQGEDGQKYLVGLGTAQDLDKVEIHKGDQVTIRGPSFEFEGQHVLLARQLTAHGQTIHLGEQGGRPRE